MMIRVRVAAAGVLSLLIISAGCTPRGNPDAPCAVRGKVTYNNSPVTGGFLFFHLPDGAKTAVPILADGSYSADLKEGTYSVTVETESINPGSKQEYRGQGGGGGIAAKYGGGGGGKAGGLVPKGKGQQKSPGPEGGTEAVYVKIPTKYADKSTSGLSVTLNKGKNEYNISLTD